MVALRPPLGGAAEAQSEGPPRPCDAPVPSARWPDPAILRVRRPSARTSTTGRRRARPGGGHRPRGPSPASSSGSRTTGTRSTTSSSPAPGAQTHFGIRYFVGAQEVSTRVRNGAFRFTRRGALAGIGPLDIEVTAKRHGAASALAGDGTPADLLRRGADDPDRRSSSSTAARASRPRSSAGPSPVRPPPSAGPRTRGPASASVTNAAPVLGAGAPSAASDPRWPMPSRPRRRRTATSAGSSTPHSTTPAA